jgi:hypothetical protein
MCSGYQSDLAAFRANMERVQNDCAAITERLRSDFKAVAQRLCSDCSAIVKRLQSDCKTISWRLRSDFAVIAKRLRCDLKAAALRLYSDCAEIAQRLRRDCTAITHRLRKACDESTQQLRREEIAKRFCSDCTTNAQRFALRLCINYPAIAKTIARNDCTHNQLGRHSDDIQPISYSSIFVTSYTHHSTQAHADNMIRTNAHQARRRSGQMFTFEGFDIDNIG